MEWTQNEQSGEWRVTVVASDGEEATFRLEQEDATGTRWFFGTTKPLSPFIRLVGPIDTAKAEAERVITEHARDYERRLQG